MGINFDLATIWAFIIAFAVFMILKLANRAYVMRGGEVRRSGTVAEIRDVALADEYL